MQRRASRIRRVALLLSVGTALAFNGCGLNDQQVTQIISSVITAGLTAVVNGAVGNLTGTPNGA